MSGDRPSRWSSQRVRLGIVVSLFLAVCGLALLGRTSSQAQTQQAAPQAAAFFYNDKHFYLAVTMPPGKAKGIEVKLLDAGGKDLASLVRPNQREDEAGTNVYDLGGDKAKAAELRIVCLVPERFEFPLGKILLAKGHETALTMGQEFFAGSSAPFRCDVYGVRSVTENVPYVGSDVSIRLQDKDGKAHKLYEGKTDRTGRIEGQLQIPTVAAGNYTLQVTTRSGVGEEKLERSVRVKNDAKILLVSDKPVYQPGQVIHLRALTLRPFDLHPVENADILFEVEDGKGNKVFKRTLRTSAYGVAAADFQLADEVNMGDYHLRAVLNETRAEKTVQVKRYTLPRFKVNVTADKKYYLPKETVKAELQADYFFGKPLAGAKVKLTASTFDVQFRPFHTWDGQTDEHGHVKFEVKLPDYFVGQPLQKGNALVKLEARVTDTADHSETVVKSYTVSEQPIQVSLIPEGGKLAPGMENRVFAAAVYPDGSPAVCDVKLWLGKEAKGEPLASVTTNDAGLAEFRLTPRAEQFRTGNFEQRNIELLGGTVVGGGPAILLDVHAESKDRQGNTARTTAELNSHPLGENILLRLNKAIYQSADSVEVDVRSSAGLPTAYLDIVRDGQTLLTRWLEVKEGKAGHRLDLPQNIFGSLEIHAYQMLRSGEIIRDSRVVYVQPRDDLKIEVKADKAVYSPGENGRIRFLVTDSAGRPTAAALGVIVVDEAVYALQELQPGLEKVYFTLQEELLKPQAQVLKYQPQEPLDHLIRVPVLPAPKQQVAEVLLTAVKVRPPARWEVAPALERRNAYESKVQQIGWGLYRYAWQNESFMKFDEAKGRWTFSSDLMQSLLNSGHLHPALLEAPLGGKLTLESLMKAEKGFSVEDLAWALTKHRLQRLSAALVQHTEANKAQWLKDGKWTLPATVLADAARQQGLDDTWLHDAWGQAFKLVKTDPRRPNKKEQTLFDQYDIVSAGPDRDFASGDDVYWTALREQTVGGWWAAGDQPERLAEINPYLGGLPGRGGMLRGMDRGRFDMQWGMRQAGQQERLLLRNGAAGPMPAAAQFNAPEGMARLAKKAERGEAKDSPGPGGAPQGQAPARVREYFPETMLWQPNLITDERGVADLAVNFADSITTWRLSASASSRGGALGGVNVPLKVFQDFFVDLDLPLTLTQNDEVAFPVAVYNYLKTPQTVKLELQQEPWFDLADGGGLTRSLELRPEQVTSVHFRIRARRVGHQPLTLKATGSAMSDAVKRLIEVVPDGQRVEKVVSDRLGGKVRQTIEVPQEALADSSKLLVRIYPGVMAQVLEGTEGMLRLPGGCFEQTSSSAYPNILVVDYIKKARLASPELLMKSENYLNVGYQRLLTFERPGGGFDWWGSGEPLIWLSAYGLQEFSDMARVYPIDRGIIDRTQQFLMKKRDKDGTWSNIGATHSETIANMGNPKLLLTSYVTWSLLESGVPKAQMKPSIDYIRANLNDAKDNAYILALAANALAAYDAKDDSTLEALQRLEKQRQAVPEWKASVYPTRAQSLTYARGDNVNIETTALAVLAMVKTGQFTASVNQALTYLVKAKEGNGTWGSTQATILALKAMLAGMSGSDLKEPLDFAIVVNGKQAARGRVTPEDADVMQTFDLKGMQPGANQVQIEVKGESSLMYQVVGRYHVPWPKETQPTTPSGFAIDVAYDRTKLATNDLLRARATVKYRGALPANMVMVDLGIAPGFTVDAGDFAEMVGRKQIARFSVTSRQVILYLNDLRPGEERTFEYTLKARFPLRAQAPAAVAYEYYTPANRATSRPVELTVTDHK